jgi:hypothetical protein
MSVEKLSDASRIQREESPYAQILNTIIEHIKDNDAYRIYCYLYSKTTDWNVRKAYTSEMCGVAVSKAKKCWSYLNRCGLLEYIPITDDKGRFEKHDVRVLNGTRFKPDEPFLASKDEDQDHSESSGRKIHPVDKPVDWETTRLEIDPLLKKDSTKEGLEQKRESAPSRKSYCPGLEELIISDTARDIAQQKNLDIVKTALAFMAYAKSNGWLRTDWKAAFEKWLLDERSISAPQHITNQPNQIRCTAKEWGPGHPDWERLNNVEAANG